MTPPATPPGTGDAPEPDNRRMLAALAAMVAAAGVLRLFAAGGDLWQDEIWSLDNLALARAHAGPRDWLALFFHDNTHALNTFWLALVGPGAGPLAYRALSVASGTAMVAMAGAVGWRRSPLEGVIAAALIALSYPLVHYAGEARGYAPMMLAALAAFYMLDAWADDVSEGDAPDPFHAPGRVAAFAGVGLVGLVSHATFVVVLAGLGVWAAAIFYRRLGAGVPAVARLVVLFGIQAVAVAAYSALALGNFRTGGGVYMPVAESVGVLAALTIGAGPDPNAWWAGWAVPALGLGLVAAAWGSHRTGDASWLFFAIVAIGYPLAFVVADPPLGTVPRYFIVSALFATLLAARGLAAAMAAGRGARAAALGLLALFAVGQGLALEKFLAAGRGDFTGAVRAIAEAGPSAGGPARVAGYHPTSIGMTITYHARRLGLGARVRFVPPVDETTPAEWYIDGHFAAGHSPAETITRGPGRGAAAYALVRVFPHWGLSGDTWALYRRKG